MKTTLLLFGILAIGLLVACQSEVEEGDNELKSGSNVVKSDSGSTDVVVSDIEAPNLDTREIDDLGLDDFEI